MAYFPITALGLLDGVYIRWLGKDYEELNKPLLSSQFRILAIQQIILAVVLIFAVQIEEDPNRTFALSAAAIYMVQFNLIYFIGYIFQSINNTWVFSLSIIIDRAIFVVELFGLLATGSDDFRIYIIAYTVSKLVAFGYCLYKGREFVFCKGVQIKEAATEIKSNIQVGAKLIVGNLAGMFVIGCGRMVVDWHWGIEAFSVFSFSVTLVNFFLTFINQISMVLLPALKRTNEKSQTRDFDILRQTLPVLMLGVMIFYVPGKQILSIWLPKYQQSFVYMAMLLPICVFDGKMQLVNNVYLKMLRKETMILKINVTCVAVAAISSVICAVLFNSPELVMLALVVIIAARSVYAEHYLEKLLHAQHRNTVLWEIVLSFVFVAVNLLLPVWMAFAVYALCYLIYIAYNKNIVVDMATALKKSNHY